MFPRICVSAIPPAPPRRAAPLPPVEMDTAPAACCPAEIIRPPGRGRPLLHSAIHTAARCPGHVHGPGGLLPLDTSPAPAACCPPGHVARDPRRKQSGPNEIKTCCPFTGGDPRRPLPRPWTPAPPWTRAAPAACRDPRRRSWTRRPGCPCGRACEELPAAWTRRRICQPSRRAIHPAAILDTSPTAPAPGGDPRRPAAELARRPAPRPCCPCHRPRSAPRRAAPLDARPRTTPRAITRALRAPGCNPYGVAFTV